MKADDFACSGCCAHFDSESDVASTDYPPGDPEGRDDDYRYWCATCFLAHIDGHPGDPDMQKRCSPQVCPTYSVGWR